MFIPRDLRILEHIEEICISIKGLTAKDLFTLKKYS